MEFGTNELIFLSVYVLLLIGIGLRGRMARKENSLSDFYLGGRNLGLFVLFLTLYATQYSGTTLLGFAGRAYRQGFVVLYSVSFMVSVIGAYLIYAPKLYRLSQKHRFITPGDYIHHRFGSTALTLTASIIGIIILGNYVLSNLKALGHIVVLTTGGRLDFAEGILLFSLIIVLYETLGGMRSVAWSDALQGILLLIGCLMIFWAIQTYYGGLNATAEYLRTHKAELWQAPDWAGKRQWLSSLCLGFFGIAIYPHAIQRIYAARNAKTLRRSFQWMAFMPLVTTFLIVIVGVVAISRFPELSRAESETVTLKILEDIANQAPALRIMMVVFLVAVIAAIMSTVDSALLAISALFTQDLFRRWKPATNQDRLTRYGKGFSWIMMAILAWLAIALPQTIWRLFEVKLEMLMQVAPAIYLGLYWPRLKATPILWGMWMGTLVALTIMFSPELGLNFISTKPWGLHAGVWGLIINFGIILLSEWRNGLAVSPLGRN